MTSSQKVGFVFDEVCLGHHPPQWHPDTRERLDGIVLTMKASDLWGSVLHLKSRRASLEDIERVHLPGYVKKIMSFGTGKLDEDTYVSEGSVEAAFHAAGAVMEAVEQCRKGELTRAFCAIRPPGHHAEAGEAMGFCIFNNIAVGARYAQAIGYRKVFIADFDAHHGNGTQHIFEEDDTVFYFSTHQHPYYPDTGKDLERGRGKGTGYTYNVPVPAGSGNKDFLYVYQDLLPGIIGRFAPDIILVSAGYDIHVNDPHADIRVSHEGVRAIVRSILTASSCPVVFALEGGYDVPSLCDSVKITIEEMLKY